MLSRRRSMTLIIALCCIFLLFGCTQEQAGPVIEPSDHRPQQQQEDDVSQPVIPEIPVSESPNNTNDDAQIASDEDDEQDGESSDQLTDDSESATNDSQADVDEEEPPPPPELTPYKPGSPALLGLTIGQNKERIRDLYGNPREQYVMEDPLDPITVYEYDGFTIGYNQHHSIAFIDIYAPTVVTGLNGLRIGDTVDSTVRTLGEPDTRTMYVLNYVSADATLKFDLDPQAQTVTSIKLFSNL